MVPPIACVMCLVPPEAQQFAVPLAQATVIAAPVLLRDNIRRGWAAVRRRRAARDRSAAVSDVSPRETLPPEG
jgi:hypothetical protein